MVRARVTVRVRVRGRGRVGKMSRLGRAPNNGAVGARVLSAQLAQIGVGPQVVAKAHDAW